MKKHMKLVGIFGGVVAVILSAVWAGWSLDVYKTANKYADQLTVAWGVEAVTNKQLQDVQKMVVDRNSELQGLLYEYLAWAAALIYRDGTTEKINISLTNALSKNPEYFGFKGDLKDAEAVQKWVTDRAKCLLEYKADGLTAMLEDLEKTATAAPVPPAPALTAPAPAPVTSATPTAPVPTASVPAPTLTPTSPVVPAPISPVPAVPAPTVQTPTPAAPDRLKLATVGKGEGIEHAFIRQLVADPSIVEGVKVKVLGKVYDLTYKGDKGNAKELKKWAGWAADLIAQNQGYVNFASGREIRVKSPNEIAYLLDKKDSNVTIGEIVLEGNKVAEAKQSSSDNVPLFEGDTSDGVQNYEYVYTPSAQTAQTSSNTNTVSNSSPHQISANLFVSGLQIDFVWGTESVC